MRVLLSAFIFAFSVPVVAVAQDKRSSAAQVEVTLSVLPVAVDHVEVRSASSLRDSLRQPLDESSEKPYRLSPEARQLMREQLRTQAAAREPQKN